VAAPFHVQRKTPELKQPKWMDRRYKEALATASLAVSNNHCNCNCNGSSNISNFQTGFPTLDRRLAGKIATPFDLALFDRRYSHFPGNLKENTTRKNAHRQRK